MKCCPVYYCPKCGVVQRHSELTSREIEVLRLYAKGKSTNEIGDELFISAKTVDAHRGHIILKTGTLNIIDAVIWGIKRQIVLI